MTYPFTEAYPNIAQWIEERGWIEVGADEYSDDALRALEKALQQWL